MPRQARVVIPNLFYHVTQRGNNQRIIFKTDMDRLQYLRWINEYSLKFGVQFLCYCLMDNHVHFIAKPKNSDSLAKTFSVAHQRYAFRINQKHAQSGHLWQGRFYSCILGERHLVAAMRYVERNPVRARLVKNAWDWRWSSAKEHTGTEKSDIPLLSDNKSFGLKDWKDFLSNNDTAEDLKTMRTATQAGGMIGEQNLIKKLELKYGVTLLVNPRGRPWPKEEK